MIRLLHFGDMHLDSPFSGVSVSAGERLREELRAVFDHIIDLAAANTDTIGTDRGSSGYDMILIAGDLFDNGYVSPDTIAHVRDKFRECGIPIVIAPGNHDPYSSGSIWRSTVWSDNVYIFPGDSLSSFDIDLPGNPVTVWGWGFTSDRLDRCPLDGGITPKTGRINLICAHADTMSPISKYCPLPQGLLKNSGCVYAALGHVHNPPQPQMIGNTLTAYCGFPEGRSFDETGWGGVLSVTICEDRPPVIERIITGRHRYEILHADITGDETHSDVIRRLTGLCRGEGYNTDTSLLICLEGAVPPHFVPDTSLLADDLTAELEKIGTPLCSATLRDRTSPVFGAEYLEHDLTIRGELYRTLLPALSSENPAERERAAAALRIGLLALDGKAFI